MSSLYLISGLFLGWSLGANDAGHVFGTAVGTRMVKFRTAAILFSVFVLIGAVFSGSGTTATLNALGGISSISASFIVAFSAGLSVLLMTRFSLPVSTTQAIVGAIIGWNLFSGIPTNPAILIKILSTWLICPVLTGVFSVLIYMAFKAIMRRRKIHLLTKDAFLRNSLILVGILGSYTLGANNIANVVGVFINNSLFRDIRIYDLVTFTASQQLFFVGGLAVSVGVFTYSRKVIDTVGRNLMKLSAETALVVVLAQALVMFLFSSVSLQQLLLHLGLPSIPLVPVSSSQAVIGGIIGIGLLKSPGSIRYNILGQIGLGWLATPLLAGFLSFMILHIFQVVLK